MRKWDGLMPGRVCSHPGHLLEDHLLNVRKLAEEICNYFNIELSSTQKDAFLFHDLAKAHPSFQRRLCGRCPEQNNCGNYRNDFQFKLKRLEHSSPSAVMFLAYAHDLFTADAIRRHHTSIQNFDEIQDFWINELTYSTNEKTGFYDLIYQIPVWDGAKKIFPILKIKPTKWQDLLPSQEEWEEDIFDLTNELLWGDNDKVLEWLKLRLFYSILITADRWDAKVRDSLNYHGVSATPAKIEDYVSKLPPNNISSWRGNLRLKTVASAQKNIAGPGIYTLTLPTGAGKTLIGLEIALSIVNNLGAKKIIYVLPFLSLIEQNADVARKIFSASEVEEDHHLAFANPAGAEKENGENNFAKEFISFFRYWLEPVTITTFAKFWDVIFSPYANDTMSFHTLQNAVVLLDEIQSIPAGYWQGLGEVLQLISKKMNTIFILMTATQPEIGEGKELSSERVFFPIPRHDIKWQPQVNSFEALFELLKDEGLENEDTMLVFNTRKSALEFYFQLEEIKEELKNNTELFFLSSWVTPKDRRRIIEALKRKERQKEQRWLVTTQVVEAGIDLDFGLVLRDLGPLDSIIQIAGRCNRHGSRPYLGRVFITELRDERNDLSSRTYASYVYDSILLSQTRLFLNKHSSFNEKEYPLIIEEYYRLIKEAVKEESIWKNIEEGKWGEYQRLIQERHLNEVTLVIDKTGELFAEMQEILKLENRLENVAEKRNFFRKLGQYSVEVPFKYLMEWEERLGSYIITEEEPILERVEDIWFLKPPGIDQKVYFSNFGFVPVEIFDAHCGQE